MPTLSQEAALSGPIKMLLIGHSGVGKTGALTSLVKDGYKLRILDFDNGLAALTQHILAECPDKMPNVSYMSFRDRYSMGPTGPMVSGGAKAVIGALKALERWEDGSVPAEWGTDTIVVLDSITAFGRAAYAWARQMNLSVKEKRQWYQAGQEVIEDTIATLTGEGFGPNVICISHIDVRTQPDGSAKGYTMALGEALGPKLPIYFNTLIVSETSGFGSNVKRKLKTVPTVLVDAKNPAPMKIAAEYPIDTGLSMIFKTLKGQL